MVVFTRCSDPSRLDEFNEWYSFHHQPDVVEAEHFLRGSRYRLIGKLEGTGREEPGEYLALYEVDSDDLPTLQKAVKRQMKQKRAAGRILQHETCDVISAAFYALQSEVSKAPES